jgi:hypothetical protein
MAYLEADDDDDKLWTNLFGDTKRMNIAARNAIPTTSRAHQFASHQSGIISPLYISVSVLVLLELCYRWMTAFHVILKGTVKLLYIFHLEESKNFTLCD